MITVVPRTSPRIAFEMPEILLPASVRELPQLANFIRTVANDNNDLAFQLGVVLEELFVNVADHAQPATDPLQIRISAEPAGNGLHMTVADNGQEFDPTTRPEPDLQEPLETRQPGGLGIHFVRRFTHDLAYAYVQGWNTLTFRI